MDPEIADVDPMKAAMLEAADKQKAETKAQTPSKSIFESLAERFGLGKKAEPQTIAQTPTPEVQPATTQPITPQPTETQPTPPVQPSNLPA